MVEASFYTGGMGHAATKSCFDITIPLYVLRGLSYWRMVCRQHSSLGKLGKGKRTQHERDEIPDKRKALCVNLCVQRKSVAHMKHYNHLLRDV
jgi:hypothetical protein